MSILIGTRLKGVRSGRCTPSRCWNISAIPATWATSPARHYRERSNPACGDILRLAARFESGRIAEARFKVRGCTASIAAGSALTEWLAGKTPAELALFQPAAIDDALGGLPPASKHAAALCAGVIGHLAGLPT